MDNRLVSFSIQHIVFVSTFAALFCTSLFDYINNPSKCFVSKIQVKSNFNGFLITELNTLQW